MITHAHTQHIPLLSSAPLWDPDTPPFRARWMLLVFIAENRSLKSRNSTKELRDLVERCYNLVTVDSESFICKRLLRFPHY